MAEVLGLIHSSRGKRKALIWHRGRTDSAQPPVWDWLPFRRLRDLLQFYRGSLIGTPDLMGDTGLRDQHQTLGALKALVVLGYVEIGRLDAQTIAWKWIAGTGQRRTYQRDYFETQSGPVPLEDGPPSDETGKPKWAWVDELIHHEWSLQEEGDGFESVASNDGLIRVRPPTVGSNHVGELVTATLQTMPSLQRAATTLVLMRGLSETEAATAIGVARSTAHRLIKRGYAELQAVLISAGYGPATPEADRQPIALRELAQAA
jgi:DNA-directed RNA polymerase specialized sigma24 family protein